MEIDASPNRKKKERESKHNKIFHPENHKTTFWQESLANFRGLFEKSHKLEFFFVPFRGSNSRDDVGLAFPTSEGFQLVI